jgi:hypothetical protein
MKKASVLLAMMLALSTGAFAHQEHDDEPQAYKLEASRTANGVMLYLTDRGAKISTAGASGKLTWDKGMATMQPSGINGMEAKTAANLPAGSKAQATITFADKSVFNSEVVVK